MCCVGESVWGLCVCGRDAMLLACDATCDMRALCVRCGDVRLCGVAVCGVFGCVVCSLSENGLGAEGARALASCLGDLTGLQTLEYMG